jgi:hypothetical protein
MSEITATTLADLKAGDRVQVFDVNGLRMGQPKGGLDGTVVKVGRKLITVQYGHSYTKVFRLEDGRANDDYGHQCIKTPEQAAEDARRVELVQRLRDGGLEVRNGQRLSTRALEAVAQALDESGVPGGSGASGETP